MLPIRCARINAPLSHLKHKIDARHGDLFAPVPAQRSISSCSIRRFCEASR
jgi:hypothetical protein